MNESRTKKTIRNAQVALVYYFINLAVKFFSRRIFLQTLGSELLGLNTTVLNLLGFLNIAELGIGAAVSFSLYKPLFENDQRKIGEIISLQGWVYRRVAYTIIGGAIVLAFFFPIIFSKSNLPEWYAYATFFVFLFSSLLGYFVNYQQILFTADQKDYKIIINIQGLSIVKMILQMIILLYLKNGYMYWLVLEVVIAGVSSYVLNGLVKRNYPWLQTKIKDGDAFRKKYPDIIERTKQLFTHKIAEFVLFQTSPLIIYGFSSLTMVAIYGNYMLIINSINGITAAIFNSITAGVGNLAAEGNKEKTIDFFWQMTSFRIWLASVFCVSFYTLAKPFIILWLGNEYLLREIPFLLLIGFLFISQTRVSDIFINAYGLYKDIFAPIVEAVLNIGLSILLGYLYGLIGILTGVIISLLVVIVFWKPFFLFKYGFQISPIFYFKQYIKYLCLIGVSLLVFMRFMVLPFPKSGFMYVLSLFAKIIVYTVCSTGLFLFFEKRMRQFFLRIVKK